MDEVARLSVLAGAEINEAKKVLATEATALLHGRANAEAAEATARTTFEQGGLATDLPSILVGRAELDEGLGVLTAFVRAGLVKSNGEARRQIQGGGLKVNDDPVTDEKATLTSSSLTPEGVIKLSLGKKRHVLLKPV
jgi:tyrosyl-tRNA synthetase